MTEVRDGRFAALHLYPSHADALGAAKEREQEILEAQKPQVPPTAGPEGGAEEEEEEERIYNPLKLPMGWDGKPIPYWLYKLHGLGVEYRCEICSDHVYMGR